MGNGSESWAGILSVLTSKEPKDISSSNLTLPDYFADNGFQTYLILSGNHIWYNFNQAYDHKKGTFMDGTTHPGPKGVDDDQLILEQLDRLGPDDGGYHFFYFHLMSTHEAGYLQNRYRRYKPSRDFAGVLSEQERNQPEMKQAFVNLYDDDILQADDLIRQILEKLRQKGYLRDYWGVVTGDHGQLFGEHDFFGHGKYTYLDLLHVPLLFFGSKPLPDFPDTHFAVHLDIAPTLADLAGLDIPATWQGLSLLHPHQREWTYHFSPQDGLGNEGAVVHYAQGKILKYSRTLLKQEGPAEHEAVFDVEQDPEEKNNLIGKLDPILIEEMRLQADQHFVQE
jgi:arylsulfatase A-like enzyme